MASIDLCVFGTPHGFDSYGVPPAMGEYCEQFYRTNRRGRMLMANRRNDGSTIYSFLVYDLIETDLRQHSFFGTSFTLRGDQFIPELRKLYNLFNQAFDWLVHSGQLLTPTASTFKYLVGKFNAVEPLLDDYFRQLMSGLSNFETEYYTPDFVPNNTGQIALLNIDTPTRDLTDVFKKTQWLAVSPLFRKEDPNGNPAGTSGRNPMAINIPDIKAQYTAMLEQMTTLAINKNESGISKLNDMLIYCRDARSLMKNYLNNGNPDEKEKIDITDLSDKLGKLHDNINTLISQLYQQDIKHGGDITSGKSRDIETESDINKRKEEVKGVKKVCAKCHKSKPIRDFAKDSDICRNCAKPSIFDTLHIDSKIIAIAAVVVVLGLLALLLSWEEEQPPVNPNPGLNTEETGDIDAQFVEALNRCDFAQAHHLAGSDYDKRERVKEKFFENGKHSILEAPYGHSTGTWRDYCNRYSQYSYLREIKLSPEYTAMQTLAGELDAIAEELNVYEMAAKDKNRLKDRINNLGEEYAAKKYSFLCRLDEIADKKIVKTTEPSTGETVTKNVTTVAVTPANIKVYRTSSDYINILEELTLDDQFILKEYYKISSDQPVKIINHPPQTVNVIKSGETIIGFSFHSNMRPGVIKFETGGKVYEINIVRS